MQYTHINFHGFYTSMLATGDLIPLEKKKNRASNNLDKL